MLAETSQATTLALQATEWAATLNGTPLFNRAYTATAAGAVLSVAYQSGDASDYLPATAISSNHLRLTASTPPRAVGRVALFGVPTGGETAHITLDHTDFALAQTSGHTTAQQAADWCDAINGAASPSAPYLAVNAGDTIGLFTTSTAAVAA